VIPDVDTTFRVQLSALVRITPVRVAKTPKAITQVVTKSFSHAAGTSDCSIAALMPKTSDRIDAAPEHYVPKSIE
jgi:hypothetical protein